MLLVFNLIFMDGESRSISSSCSSPPSSTTPTEYWWAVQAQRRRPGRPAGGVLLSGIQPGAAFFFQVLGLCRRSLAAIGLPLMPILGWSLPIGISFYTFQTMSYTIDVYRGDAPVQRNLINFGTFVTLFPSSSPGRSSSIRAGRSDRPPGPRWSSLPPACRPSWWAWARKYCWPTIWGKLWDAYKALPAGAHHGGRLAGRDRLLLQIYFDFSGYSDMAVGLGRMLGFEL